MSVRPAIGFALGAATVASISTIALLPWLGGADGTSRWALAGWVAMSVPGVVAGTWLAREHGRPGAGFVVALGAGMLARALAGASVAAGAARAGQPAITAALAGLVAGFVPVLVFEIIWCARSHGTPVNPAETRG